ncbi:MAG: nuclear transport factor 2 family protein [Gemmatimonadaceae bacterium]|nr:nuclear transport factor 2 family protein [Gemmatimonadaceae bacterium]
MLHLTRTALLVSSVVLALHHVVPEPPVVASPDRDAIIQTINNFYVGDHTGSIEHKQKSMHPRGAFRFVDKAGNYQESTFQLVASKGDTLYKEELLSIEIYETVALARLRLASKRRPDAEYKLMTLHKTNGAWLITGISWGWGVTQ